MRLIDMGEQLAKAFRASGQDIFTIVTEIEGMDVTVTVKYAPMPVRIPTKGEVWNRIAERLQTEPLIKL